MIIILTLVIAMAGFIAVQAQLKPADTAAARQVTLEIPQQAATSSIAALLEEKGLIRSSFVFRLYTRYQNVDGKLKPGAYMLNSAMSVPEIVQKMLKGPNETIVVTIPEGFTVEQIAELLESKGVAGREDFLRLTEKKWDYPFVQNIDLARNNLEGYLFPDTYHIGLDTGPDKLLQMMLEKFQNVIAKQDYVRQVRERRLTLHEAVIFASMVEREAKMADERARIAGVIYNRIESGMPLQIDATIQYVLDEPREILLYSDLEVDSPYNTYRHYGFPPAPIASPGWASLRAVIEPESHDYLYYVAKPDGSHAFSRTLAEHNANIRKYQ